MTTSSENSPDRAPDAANLSLIDLRRQIDALDAQLVTLISARGRLAAEIGRRKTASGAAVYAPDRESEVLAAICRQNPGPFPDRALLAIYRELMSGSFLLERPLRIAYLGPRGSFSHLAASGKFGGSVDYEPVADIPAVFAEVEREHVDFGVVPVENSIGGGILDTLDAFTASRVQICAEVLRRIHHNLLARGPLAQIERLYSKPEIFDQCKGWLLETGLLDKTVPVASSSRAAELAAAEPNAAAIGSTLAAELYGLPVQLERIEDNPENVTRFLVLGREPARPTGDDKTALMFAMPDHAGALVDVLDIFRAEQINLSMITSRPSRQRNWQYYFFVDAAGHGNDPPLVRALERARAQCPVLRVLGSFPRARDAY
jgi:chorismate mutase/prephenate dehydratase